jgi:hypothetical protein
VSFWAVVSLEKMQKQSEVVIHIPQTCLVYVSHTVPIRSIVLVLVL